MQNVGRIISYIFLGENAIFAVTSIKVIMLTVITENEDGRVVYF
jgi:hypothetical protein